MSLSPGTRLGPYEILSPLGAGGMGEVWKARDTRLERTVAIKVLPSHLSSSSEVRQRFEREAKTISQLSHPHICALYDVGNQDGVEYLVMEYLEGETLSERLLKGPLPMEQTLRYGIEIADALDKAHRQGIVHRDLKPGNVMLARSGVKLLDFGLAKAVAPVSQRSGLTSLPTMAGGQNLTQEGTILGTFQYMAPEQLEGKEADARTDIFAFGAVLYEMATGRKAFAGASQASLISSIMTKDPEPISSIEPLTPPAMDRVVRTCLSKDPEDRWQSAGDVAKELKWIAEGGSGIGMPAPIAARRKSQEIVAWLVAAAAVIGLTLVLVLFRRPHTESITARSFLLPPEKMEFETSGDNCASLTVSPDGRNVTFAAKGKGAEGKPMLWLRSLGSLTAHAIPGTEGAMFPFWSPDSRSLAFFAGGKLQRVDLAGEPMLAICDAPNGRSGSWNRDGVILFSPNTNTEVFQVAASGGTPTPATHLDVASNETTHRWATFLPDGRHFLYMAGSHSEGSKSASNAIYLASLGSAERTRILQGHSNVAYASGSLLSAREHVLLAQSFDPRRGRFTGDPVPLADGIQNEANYFRGDFSVSDNGILVYATGTAGTGSRLQRFDMKTGQPAGEPFGDPAEYRDLTISSDDSRIAATIGDPSTGLPEIWLVDNRGARAHFTFGGPAFSPVFSPDGNRVAFARGKGIFVKPVGGGAEESLYTADAQVAPTDWSPDGRFLAFGSVKAGSKTRLDIWILPLFGGRKAFPFVATEANERSATFSPNGRWISYVSDESGRPEVYVAAFPGPGGKWQISVNGAVGASWVSDHLIGFGSLDFHAMEVDLQEKGGGLEIGAPRTMFQVPPMDANPAAAPGAKTFVLALHNQTTESARVVLVSNWAAGLKQK